MATLTETLRLHERACERGVAFGGRAGRQARAHGEVMDVLDACRKARWQDVGLISASAPGSEVRPVI
jgi:hypothetical protein